MASISKIRVALVVVFAPANIWRAVVFACVGTEAVVVEARIVRRPLLVFRWKPTVVVGDDGEIEHEGDAPLESLGPSTQGCNLAMEDEATLFFIR